MKILVLGGNGFIGSHVVDALVAAGHSVRVLDRSPERYRPPVEGVEYQLGDSTDSASLDTALDGMHTVIHLVSTTVPATSNADPIADVQANLVGSLTLLQGMRKHGASRIVFLSSGGSVYGVPDTVPVTEATATKPISSHAIIKLAVEKYLFMFRELYDIDYAVLRVSNPYGERQGHLGVQGVIGTFIDRIKSGKPIEVWGDGSVERDYIYVGDVAAACRLAAESGASGVFNIGSEIGHSVREIVAHLSTISDCDIDVRYGEARDYDVPRIVLDCSKARQTLGWQAETTLEDGLRLAWSWSVEQ